MLTSPMAQGGTTTDWPAASPCTNPEDAEPSDIIHEGWEDIIAEACLYVAKTEVALEACLDMQPDDGGGVPETNNPRYLSPPEKDLKVGKLCPAANRKSSEKSKRPNGSTAAGGAAGRVGKLCPC